MITLAARAYPNKITSGNRKQRRCFYFAGFVDIAHGEQ